MGGWRRWSMSSVVKLPVTVAQIRDLAVAAGVTWPEWMVPDAPAFVVVNRGYLAKCKDCDGTARLTLASGRQIDCACGDGNTWVSRWVVMRAQLRLSVVANSDGTSLHVTAFVMGRDPKIGDLFPTLEAAQAEAAKRNQGGVTDAS